MSMEHFQVSKTQRRRGNWARVLGEEVRGQIAPTLAGRVRARVISRVSVVVGRVQDASEASRKLLRDWAMLFGSHGGLG